MSPAVRSLKNKWKIWKKPLKTQQPLLRGKQISQNGWCKRQDWWHDSPSSSVYVVTNQLEEVKIFYESDSCDEVAGFENTFPRENMRNDYEMGDRKKPETVDVSKLVTAFEAEIILI